MSDSQEARLRFIPKYPDFYRRTGVEEQSYSIELNLEGLVKLNKTVKPNWFYGKLLASAYCQSFNSGYSKDANVIYDTMCVFLDTIYENDIVIDIYLDTDLIPTPSKNKGISSLSILKEYFPDQGYKPVKIL